MPSQSPGRFKLLSVCLRQILPCASQMCADHRGSWGCDGSRKDVRLRRGGGVQREVARLARKATREPDPLGVWYRDGVVKEASWRRSCLGRRGGEPHL